MTLVFKSLLARALGSFDCSKPQSMRPFNYRQVATLQLSKRSLRKVIWSLSLS